MQSTSVAAAAPTESAEGLHVRGIVKRFRGVTALRDVSLSLAAGEIVGLIGPNGSGKTTLLNIASGVLRPTEGLVSVDGVTIQERRPHRYARAGIGRTFQQIRLFGGMTVRDNVRVGEVCGAGHADSLDQLLERMNLTADVDRLAGTLSYGHQRRVEIARAVASGPRYLLLDEPAAGMNERESDDLLSMLYAVRDEYGCAVLVVDHDLRLIMRACDRILVLAEGRAIAAGLPADIQRDAAVRAAYLGGHEDTGSSPDAR